MATVPLSELLKLSPAERIQLVQDLWDSIATEPEVLPPTDEQRQELTRRSEAHRKNPEAAIPLDDALERIERSLG
jgi:putative addiction module component (TIGR02574 family)